LSVTIDRNRIEPPYLQLAAVLEADIRSGRLAPGARVPSISTLMGTYDIGKNTAIRAVAELRDKALVEVRPGWYYIRCFSLCERTAAQCGDWFTGADYIPSPLSAGVDHPVAGARRAL